MLNGFKNEDCLICLCCRLNHNPEEKLAIRESIKQPLNWDYILGQLKEHKVATLFFRTISNPDLRLGDDIPSHILSKLQQTYYVVAKENIAHYEKLRELLIFLNQEGIPVILLKGFALAGIIYQNLALRQMVDIDLLVKKEDFARFKECLLSYGFKQAFRDLPWAGFLEDFGSEMYLSKSDYLPLDIHAGLSQYERFKGIIKIDEEDRVWQRAQRLDLLGTTVTILSPEDMILHLCLHLSLSHFFYRLANFCDLRETALFYKQQLDWNCIVQKARDFSISRIVYHTLGLTQDLLGGFMEGEILEKLRPPRLREKIVKLILCDKICSLKNLRDIRNKYIFQLFALDSWEDTLRLIFRIIFPSSEWLRYRYAIKNRRLSFFYRFLHPFLILKTLIEGKMELKF